jgi:GntR family transcriptional regulator/MocR family aminotransferase
LDVFLSTDVNAGLAEQIYEQVRSAIVDGRLRSGDRLPPSRELAASLGVSRHTVTTAYGRLSAEGYLDGRRGGGTVVADLFVTGRHPPDRGSTTAVPRAPDGPRRVAYDLRAGTPDPRLFPTAEWKRYLRRAVDRHDGVYGDPAGTPELRHTLASWIARSRAVVADPEQVVVTCGAQQALYLLARAHVGTGDVVAVEDPGYPPFRHVVEAIGAEVVGVPVDDEGMVVDAIPGTARLVHVTPSHQFPTGSTMSMGRRLALLSAARRTGMVIVEDDYDSEYRHVDRPLEPLFRLDRNSSVVYVASFSKILSPALRLGFAVVPPALLPGVVGLRRLIDRAPSAVDQSALLGFIADGWLDRHLRRARRVYRARHRLVSDRLRRLAERGVVEAPASNAGLHVAARFRGRDDEEEVVARLEGRGVAVEGLGSYVRRMETAHSTVAPSAAGSATGRSDRAAFAAVDWSLFCAIGVIWGSSYLLIKIALDTFHPGLITWGRIALGPWRCRRCRADTSGSPPPTAGRWCCCRSCGSASPSRSSRWRSSTSTRR